MASIISRSPSETFDFGVRYASQLRRGDVLALMGDLGAGKTQFVKGLASGLGFDANVTSPTFTLIQEYRGGALPLYHLDFYRLESIDELLQIGVDEYLPSDGITAVEWAGKFIEIIPANAVGISFRVLDGDEREIVFPS